MACASSRVSGLRSRSSLGRRPLCGPCSKRETNPVSAPNCLIFSCTWASKPVISAATSMITLTPSTTPNTVSVLRSLCARSVSIACFRFSPCCWAILYLCDSALRDQRSSAIGPQRFNGIELCGSHRGIDSKEKADRRGNAQRQNHGADGRSHGDGCQSPAHGNQGIRQTDADQPASRGQHGRFGHKLKQNVFLSRAQRTPQSNLAC